MENNPKIQGLFPGSKGWIQKYFSLAEEQQISFSNQVSCGCTSDELHLFFIHHGILFGTYVEPIFLSEIDDSKWTNEEKVKFLLLESLLYSYLCRNTSFEKDKFVQETLIFYSLFEERSTFKLLNLDFISTKTPDWALEKILSAQVEIKSSFISTNKWFNYIQNSFVFLDVLLFDRYLHESKNLFLEDIDNLKINALLTVIRAAHSDNLVTKEEEKLFESFLEASNLPSEKRKELRTKFMHNCSSDDFLEEYLVPPLFRYYLLDIAILTVNSKETIVEEEENFIIDFASFLRISEEQLLNAKVSVQQFVFQKSDFVPALSNDSRYEKMLGTLSQRWLKILSRNKDKFVSELVESKEFISLLKKAMSTDLSAEEKRKVTEQFKDIFLKSMPSLAVFMLPGGVILLPLLLKIIPDLLPSSFRDNEIDK